MEHFLFHLLGMSFGFSLHSFYMTLVKIMLFSYALEFLLVFLHEMLVELLSLPDIRRPQLEPLQVRSGVEGRGSIRKGLSPRASPDDMS